VLVAALLPIGAAQAAPSGAEVSGDLLAKLAAPGSTTGFMVYLKARADLRGAATQKTTDAKATHVYQQLTNTADSSQAGVRGLLSTRNAQFRTFWIANAVYVNGDKSLVDALAARNDVQKIEPAKQYELIKPVERTDGAKTQAVEWGLTNIKAPDVWSTFGVRGEGITVANIDSGVQFDHPALVNSYRGNLGGGTFDHNYNWFDPSGICPSAAPCDNNDHGTHTMGTMVGDDGAGNQIGVAPGAKWIASKGCETNGCSDTALLASAQWVLAPTDLNGNNPRPDLHADIVNNSWGGGGGDLWYQQSVQAWLSAGMFPSFSNGNSGPGCGTAGSPGDYPETYAAGAYDINNNIAGFSSRGASAVDGGIKPNIAAPGVNVRSSIPGGYANFSGTSMAAPHVSGTVALIWSAAPSIRGDVAATKALLDDSATDNPASQCGGTDDDNNVFGEGRLNALTAVTNAPRGPQGRIVGLVTDSATGNPLAGVVVTADNRSSTTGPDGRYSITVGVGTYTVTASKYGYATGTASVTVTEGAAVTQDFALVPLPAVTVSGKVTDGSGHGWPLYAKIEVAGTPLAPVYTNPVNGRYSVSLPSSSTYQFTVTAVYPGYQTVTQEVVVGAGNKTQDIAVPIAATCSAPGYRASWSTPVLTQTFDTTSTPAGWSVVNRTPGGWQFDDPGGRGNLTGGTGGFAVADSDFFGPGAAQDSDLVAPVLNLSGLSAPYVRFNTDFRSFPVGAADVDVSADGGATWTTVWHQDTVDRRGPRVEEVSLGPVAGDADALLRFRFQGEFSWWWEVDNVEVLNRNCDVVPGGLVLGFTTDKNTGAALNGVTVSSVDVPADKGVSGPTPDDAAIGDGFYWLFSSVVGDHGFTAAKAPYQPLTKTVGVVANDAKKADFALKAGRLTVTPTAIESYQQLGKTKTTTVKVSNNGSAPAEVEFFERAGGFDILGKRGSRVVNHRVPGGVSKAMSGKPVKLPGAGSAPNIDPAWTNIANYPVDIFDNGAAVVGGKLYSVGGGSSTGNERKTFVYDPDAGTWTALPDMPSARAKPGVASVGGKLYVFGGWGAGGVPVATVDVFDPAAGTWSSLVVTNPSATAAPGTAVLGGKVYLIGGCGDGSCSTTTGTVIFDPSTNTFSTGAPYPHPVAWLSCGGISTAVYCAGGAGDSAFTDGFSYDPAGDAWTPLPTMPADLWGSAYSAASGLLVIAGGVTDNFASITNRSIAYDPAAAAWIELPAAQFPRYRGAGACGAYKVGGSEVSFSGTNSAERLGGLDQCGEASDVPWLSESPESFTLAPGASRNVTVTLTATPEAGVLQPGDYKAEIGITSDTPYPVPMVDVTMHVTPPPSWGKIKGTIVVAPCRGDPSGIAATIRINHATNPDVGYSLKSGNNGGYEYWLPKGRYQVIVAKDGWVPEVHNVKIDAGFVLTLDVSLEPFVPCTAGVGGR